MMKHQESLLSVVVGIDGSQAAIHAAEWAADEAVCRDIPLRLVHVIGPGSQAVRLETEYAETALRTACAAAVATGKQVKVETAVKRGRINAVLAKESRSAEMICLGSLGTGYSARKLLGSTASALAQSAHCPVAVIRTPNVPRPESGCIAVVVADSPGNDNVMQAAMDEARLRKAPLLALGAWAFMLENAHDDRFDRRMAKWTLRYPDVDVHRVAVRTSLAEFLVQTDQIVVLAVVGNDDDQVVRPAGPIRARSVLDHAYCSVLVVRPQPHFL